MRKETIDAGKYKIIIEEKSLPKFGEYAREALTPCRFVLASDDRVHALYGTEIKASLSDAGFEFAGEFVFPHGERSKCFSVLERLLSYLAKCGLTRSDCVVALGGGVTGDMAGFAAAVYQRGIKYISVPTSLLSMVDSSVGGKTAVDIPEGKNLVGAFHEPSFVLSDPSVLSTLPKDFIEDGMAEVIKYGVLGNRGLFELLEKADTLDECVFDVVKECITDKRDIVSRDLYDRGERQKLNLGHTFGHAIELLSDFTVSHGHAVASGMQLMIQCAAANGICSDDDVIRCSSLLEKYGLDPYIYSNYSISDIVSASSHDKKRSGRSITLVVPTEIGKTILKEISCGELEAFVESGYRYRRICE